MFDPHFSHTYPLRNGLVEDIVESQRLIIEQKGDSAYDLVESSAVTYPAIDRGSLVYYSIPTDARDLTAYMKLIRSENSASNIGKLLGHRLAGVNGLFGSVPEDTILPRFSVHSSDNVFARAFQGIDMKFLPPYDRLNGKLGNIYELVREELDLIDDVSFSYTDVLINSMRNGLRYVG